MPVPLRAFGPEGGSRTVPAGAGATAARPGNPADRRSAMLKLISGALVAGLSFGGAVASERLAGVEVVGTELVIHSSGGRAIRGPDLVGAEIAMTIGGTAAIIARIDAVLQDEKAVTPDIQLYDLSARDGQGNWQPACGVDPFGGRHAILQRAPDGSLAIWCTEGAHAKCIRLGYRPWATGPDGQSLRPMHSACTRMLRADYCGDNRPTTRTGMYVDLRDIFGIQVRTEDPGEFRFEAAWDEHGAICVAHPRVPQNISLEQLAESCPRLRGRVGDACTEAGAAQFGTPLIYNASRGDGIIEAERKK